MNIEQYLSGNFMFSEKDTRHYFNILSKKSSVDIMEILKAADINLPEHAVVHVMICEACKLQLEMFITYLIYRSACKLKMIDPDRIWCPNAHANDDAPANGAAGFLENRLLIWNSESYSFKAIGEFNDKNEYKHYEQKEDH